MDNCLFLNDSADRIDINESSLISFELSSYNNGTYDSFVAALVDCTLKHLSVRILTFNINGVFYTKTTDSEGNAKLNINLMPSEYIITSS